MSTKDMVQEHFKLIELIQRKYKEGDYSSCEKYCIEDIQIFPLYIDSLSDSFNLDRVNSNSPALAEHRKWAQDMRAENKQEESAVEVPVRIVSFETLAKIYEKQQRYDDGIKVCELAIQNKLQDGTKGGFEGRLKKFEKLKKNPPKSKLNLESKGAKVNNALVEQSSAIANISFPELNWHISVSFNKSSSSNFPKAVFLTQQTSYRHYITEFEGQTIYQAIFTEEREQYLNFIQLYELVSGWKSSFAMINGRLADRKIISGLNYCYGDKCRSGRSDFCFGASEMTDNPFGCHRLQISRFNNPWWSFSYQQGNKIIIDKQAIKQRIDEYCRAYTECPSFEYNDIIRRLNNLPDFLTSKQYEGLRNGIASVSEQILVDVSTNQIEANENKQKGILSKIKSILKL